jgi:hypothetical protein
MTEIELQFIKEKKISQPYSQWQAIGLAELIEIRRQFNITIELFDVNRFFHNQNQPRLNTKERVRQAQPKIT